MKIFNVTLSLLLLFITSSVSAKTATGCFNATNACEAYQSYSKKTNPENVRLKEGKGYQILEKNRKKSTYRIHIKGLDRPARWVKSSCGEITPSCNTAKSKPKTYVGKKKALVKPIKKKRSRKTSKQGQYLLALTWQPSFCETHSRKKECRTQTTNRYDATHWSLHGLWPQPRANTYCGVSDTDKGIDRNKRWHLLAPVKLSQKTAIELAFVMPAVSSNLHRHEWIKHGTCYGTDADTYYSDAISLTKQINKSIVGKLFTKGIGKRVSLKQVRQHFDKAFGKGAGSKVDMRCDRKGRVSELWINLKGEVTDDTKIASLLKNAVRAGSTCNVGVIDKANR